MEQVELALLERPLYRHTLIRLEEHTPLISNNRKENKTIKREAHVKVIDFCMQGHLYLYVYINIFSYVQT